MAAFHTCLDALDGAFVVGTDPDAIVDDIVQPRLLAPVGRHGARPCSLAAVVSSPSTRVRACTPARQSECSANSSGECETPVGLRTNSIAVGIPACDRTPAS